MGLSHLDCLTSVRNIPVLSFYLYYDQVSESGLVPVLYYTEVTESHDCDVDSRNTGRLVRSFGHGKFSFSIVFIAP